MNQISALDFSMYGFQRSTYITVRNSSKRGNNRMYSFDVFDTLITRATKNPQGVFYVMQERISTMEMEDGAFLGKNFAQIRINAERNAGAYSSLSKEKREVNLESIYRVVMQMAGISTNTKDKLMELEVQTEIDCAVGITNHISKLRQILEMGEHVVLISDMYLSSKAIREILVSVDNIFANIPLYVSNECGCTKHTGELFLFVKEKEKASTEKWTHYGDNEISDIRSPQRLGINTVWLKKVPLLPWEKEFDEQYCLQTNAYWQLYVGIARILRQNVEMTSYEEMGASFVGMILYPYVEWIIQSSLRKGIRTLYFVARDGYVLKKIADIVINKSGYVINTKYIYGSRMAWRIQEGNEEKKNNLLLYLKQVIDFSEKFAFVEANGTGCTMECLTDIIREFYYEKVYVFYFSLKKNSERVNCLFFTYLTAYDEIVEVICRAPHGPTMGYIKNNQEIFPQIQKVDDKLWEESGLLEYIHGVELYTEKVIGIILKLNIWLDNRYLVKQIIEYISNNPDKQILSFLANMPHNNGYNDEQNVYAPGLSRKDLFNLFMWRTNEPLCDFYHGVNYKYSELLFTEKDKKIVSFYKQNYYRLFGRIIHKYKGWLRWHKSGLKTERKRVVVYAAGAMGQKIYHFICGEADYKVIAWVDKEYQLYRKQRYPVSGLDSIERKKFDIVVIAIKNAQTVREVKGILINRGVIPEKIYDADSFCAMLEKD